jgi:hypothetical protein
LEEAVGGLREWPPTIDVEDLPAPEPNLADD